MDGIAADWKVDFAGNFLKLAFYERDVGFLYGTGSKGLGQFRVGIVIFRNEDEAGGLFVETMHDSGTERVRLRSAARKILSAAQERVYERTTGVSRTSMHAHSGGLIDDEQVVVFIEDIQRDGFGFGAKGRTLHN